MEFLGAMAKILQAFVGLFSQRKFGTLLVITFLIYAGGMYFFLPKFIRQEIQTALHEQRTQLQFARIIDVENEKLQSAVYETICTKAVQCGHGHFIGMAKINISQRKLFVMHLYEGRKSISQSALGELHTTTCFDVRFEQSAWVRNFIVQNPTTEKKPYNEILNLNDVDVEALNNLKGRRDGFIFYTSKDRNFYNIPIIKTLLNSSLSQIQDFIILPYYLNDNIAWLFWITWLPNTSRECKTQASKEEVLANIFYKTENAYVKSFFTL